MLSVHHLRRAATVLRRRAKTVIARDYPGRAIDIYKIRGTYSAALASDAAATLSAIGTLGSPAYIALVHPGLALALADWFDAQADTTWCDCCSVDDSALPVADLILDTMTD